MRLKFRLFQGFKSECCDSVRWLVEVEVEIWFGVWFVVEIWFVVWFVVWFGVWFEVEVEVWFEVVVILAQTNRDLATCVSGGLLIL